MGSEHRTVRGTATVFAGRRASVGALLLSSALGVFGCGDDAVPSASASDPGTFFVSGQTRETITPGQVCEFGGYRLTLSGDADASAGLVLCNDGEVTTTVTPEDAGLEIMTDEIMTEVEAPGDHCETGGLALWVGGEVVDYLCNGAKGAPAPVQEAIEAMVEEPGENCPAGGVVVTSGDAILGYVCSGDDAAPAGKTVLARTALSAGDPTCPHGGTLLQWGNDGGDLNGVLDAAEISGEATVCDGSPALCQADYVATDNAEVAALSACAPGFYGDLTLDGEAITDLSPLLGLEEIQGALNIGVLGTPDLTGLDNLRVVRGDLHLGKVYGQSFGGMFGGTGPTFYAGTAKGLGKLEEIHGSLVIYDEGTITDFQDMSALTRLGPIMFSDVSGVASFKGLEGVTELDLVNYPPRLASFEGLENVVSLAGQGLYLSGSPGVVGGMPSLAPLQNLTEVGKLYLRSEVVLSPEEIGYLGNLRTVLGNVQLDETSETNLDLTGIAGLTRIDGSVIIDVVVPGLSALFAGVERIGAFIGLASGVTDGSFLSGVKSIGQGMSLGGLNDFSDFPNLVSIGDSVDERIVSPIFFLGSGQAPFVKCGLVSLTEVHGRVEYFNGNSWPTEDTSVYFDTLPMPACTP